MAERIDAWEARDGSLHFSKEAADDHDIERLIERAFSSRGLNGDSWWSGSIARRIVRHKQWFADVLAGKDVGPPPPL